MKRNLLLLLCLIVIQLGIRAQQSNSRIDSSTLKRIYHSVFKSYKKSRPGLETAEGFFILSISNPCDGNTSEVLGASNQIFETFGTNVLIKLKEYMPTVDSSIKQIIIPVVDIVKCKKHNYITTSDYPSKIKSILNEKGILQDSNTLVLHEMTMTGLGHLEH